MIAPRHGALAPAPRGASQVGIMRRIAAARLRYWGLQALNDDMMLIVSELLTNALLHSGTTKIGLKLTVEEGFLRITVNDGVPAGIAPVPAGEEAESGRGLILVAALAQDHGGTFGTSSGGATAWCTLAVPPQEAS
ncbi:ATP-binding protein [Streptomyces bobili]|uniref:ATP-binding protein n=1 Tax=Streptomyces bobili TaxID=67280 RepID=UPI00371293A4